MIRFRNRERWAIALVALTGSVATAQPVGYDFNDDGYSDYPVSIISYDDTNPDVGAARIWSGASKTVIHTIIGTSTNTLFGWSYGSAGDLNGDGKADLVVGEPLWSAGSDYEGRVQVYSGADASVLLTIPGPYIEAAIGRYVTGIGDWDGDGTIDIASSGWDIADTNGDGIGDDAIGIVFVFSGVDGSILTEITDPVATIGFGYSVFGLGDITNDGLADIAIVDRRAQAAPGSGIFGELYIFAGSTTATSYDITQAHRIISNTDPSVRGFAAQVDVMHPDLWHDEPTLQLVNLTSAGSGGVNSAEILVDIYKTNGVVTGTKDLRTSLQLAGDINLDGTVDALDIQDSISQLGTDPQAIGVMPIADSNSDGIIDLVDIEVVVDGYGQTTDIYEGLWDGTRLLAVAAGNAGFGNTSGISTNGPFGGTDFRPGRRPIDDCPPTIVVPTTITGSMLPSLLRSDSRVNCNECPGPNDPDPNMCWKCSEHGSLSGGEVTASPAQPGPGEPFFFTASGVTDSGGKKECECATAEPRDVPPVMPDYYWVIVQKNPDGSWPEGEDIPSNAWTSGTQTTTRSGTACKEYKAIFKVVANRECPPDPIYIEGYAEISNFTLESETLLSAPDGTDNDRTKIGIGEIVRVKVVEQGVGVTWEVEGGILLGPTSTQVRARRYEKGRMVVRAIANDGCERTMAFNAIEPDGVKMTFSGDNWHEQGKSSAGFQMCCQVQPTSVSFKSIQVGEQESAPPSISGEFVDVGMAYPNIFWNFGHEPWFLSVREDNYLSKTDKPSTYFNVVVGSWDAGTMVWSIPWKYKVTATGMVSNKIIETSSSTTDVSSTGAMWIDKTTGSGIYNKSPTYNINSPSDLWILPDDTCP